MKQHQLAILLLLIAIVGIAVFYQYPTMLVLQPQGAHIWRQSDCMAMTQNYQQFHLSFLQPATYNLQSTNGNVAGEFPVFYFIAAQLKNASFALRLIHTIIFLAGIFATYFIAFYFLQRRLLSLFCAVLMFTSPLLVFYGNNFLSDVPALSFAFIGWAIFLHHYKNEKIFGLFIAFFCFAFAALLKASEAIHFAIAFIFIVRIRRLNIKILIPYTLLLIPLFWYLFAKSYNKSNHDTYYFLSVFPIWKLSLHDIGIVIWRMVVSNARYYFWQPTNILFIISVYFLIRKRKRMENELTVLITSGFIISAIYLVLFYQKMIAHEYYYVPFFMTVLFCVIGILKVYNTYHAENVFAHTFAYLFLVINIMYCKKTVAEKLTIPMYNGYLSSNEMQLFLEKNGVTKDKSIISLPDDTPNKTLYQLKRKGYTEFNNYIDVIKNKKADYLIIGYKDVENREELKPYLTNKIDSFHDISIYKLR